MGRPCSFRAHCKWHQSLQKHHRAQFWCHFRWAIPYSHHIHLIFTAKRPKRPTRLCTTCIGRVLAHRSAPRLLTLAAAPDSIAQLTLGHGNRPSWRSRPASLTARAGHAGPRAAATDQFLHPCGCGLQNLNKILQSPLAWDFDHALQFTPG